MIDLRLKNIRRSVLANHWKLSPSIFPMTGNDERGLTAQRSSNFCSGDGKRISAVREIYRLL
jgi:hypothetical protein